MASIMETEAREVPQRIQEQLLVNSVPIEKLSKRLRAQVPAYVLTVGRGSSDHVGVYAKYLFEVELGIPTMSAAPSIVSVYNKQLHLKNALVLVVSQSGRSPDLLAHVEMAKASGALCVAIVNDEQSPLSQLVDVVLPMCVGEEKAVAATKSYLSSLSILLQLVATWKGDQQLSAAVEKLPEYLQQAILAPTQLDIDQLVTAGRCIVLGRGFAYAISREIALKLKEIFSIQAEAFSSAEFLHGPVTLAEGPLPILEVCVEDESLPSHLQLLSDISQRGAHMFSFKQAIKALHPRIAPLTLMQQFYIEAAQAAVRLGLNPDAPPGLLKVTRTL